MKLSELMVSLNVNPDDVVAIDSEFGVTIMKKCSSSDAHEWAVVSTRYSWDKLRPSRYRWRTFRAKVCARCGASEEREDWREPRRVAPDEEVNQIMAIYGGGFCMMTVATRGGAQ